MKYEYCDKDNCEEYDTLSENVECDYQDRTVVSDSDLLDYMPERYNKSRSELVEEYMSDY